MKNIVKGNVVKNIELKHTSAGTPYCVFTVAENQYKRTADGNYEKAGVNYQLAAAYHDLAIEAAKLVKGQQVEIRGSVHTLPAKGRYAERKQIIVTELIPGLKPGERPAKAA